MQQHNTIDTIRIIHVLPYVAGHHLDYGLGEELPLIAPSSTDTLVHGVGYNSADRRRMLGLPVHEATGRPHSKWKDMLTRCYKAGASAYAGCTVCKKWHDFQEFADWFVSQPYSNAPDVELDKDILDQHNSIYSPEFCSLVPRLVNQMFRNTRSQRGKLPICIKEGPRGKGFTARISKYGKQVYLGKFCDIFSAFEAYQAAYSAYCSEVADKYEGKIDPRVIERLRTCSRHIRD